MNKSQPLRGYLYIAGATLFWGISATLGRGAFTGHFLPPGQTLKPIDPLILSQSRATFSFLVLFPALVVRRGRAGLRLPRAEMVRMLLLGVLGVAFSNYLYYFAIQKTNVATAIILQYTAPVLVLFYMVARGRQRPTVKRVAAAGLACVGSGLVVGAEGHGVTLNAAGVAAALLAAVCFSYYNIAGHDILARYDHWLVLLYTTFSATAFWLVVNPPWKVLTAAYTGLEWGFLLIFAFVSVLLPFSLYFAGLRYLEPTRAIIVSCLEPVFSIILAAIVLGESVRPGQGIGVAIVLAAIVLAQLPERGEAEAVRVLEPVD